MTFRKIIPEGLNINRLQIYFISGLALCAIIALFTIKTKVTTMQLELNEVQKQISMEEGSVRTLKAEYAYLSSPRRISVLSQKYLKLRETKVSQLKYDMLNDKSDVQIKTKASVKIAKSTKHSFGNHWRYKKGPAKYITTVSKKR